MIAKIWHLAFVIGQHILNYALHLIAKPRRREDLDAPHLGEKFLLEIVGGNEMVTENPERL